MRWNLMFWISLLYMFLTNYWIRLITGQFRKIVAGFVAPDQFLIYLTSHFSVFVFCDKTNKQTIKKKTGCECLSNACFPFRNTI